MGEPGGRGEPGPAPQQIRPGVDRLIQQAGAARQSALSSPPPSRPHPSGLPDWERVLLVPGPSPKKGGHGSAERRHRLSPTSSVLDLGQRAGIHCEYQRNEKAAAAAALRPAGQQIPSPQGKPHVFSTQQTNRGRAPALAARTFPPARRLDLPPTSTRRSNLWLKSNIPIRNSHAASLPLTRRRRYLT